MEHHLVHNPAPHLLARLQEGEGQEAWLATAASLRSLLLDLLEQLGAGAWHAGHQEPGGAAKLLLLPGWQEVEGAQAISFHWLVKLANQELISTPKVTVK